MLPRFRNVLGVAVTVAVGVGVGRGAAGSEDLPTLDAGLGALFLHQIAEEPADLVGLFHVFQSQNTVTLVGAVQGHGAHAEQLLAQGLGALDVQNAVK